MNPTSTAPKDSHPFQLALARDCGWPLVTRDGRKAEVLKWDAPSSYPLIGWTNGVSEGEPETLATEWSLDGVFDKGVQSKADLFLSANYQDPRVRAAVQAAHEKLGMEVRMETEKGSDEWISCIPQWAWSARGYRLAIHLPVPTDPIALGHNPDRLTVSQVGEGWRLLERDELKVQIEPVPQRDGHIDVWIRASGSWMAGNNWGANPINTYRTRLSREDLVKLDRPAPPKFVPWDFNDGPMSLRVKHKSTGAAGVASLFVDGYGVFFRHEDDYDEETFASLLENYVRYEDGEPCGKLQLP